MVETKTITTITCDFCKQKFKNRDMAAIGKIQMHISIIDIGSDGKYFSVASDDIENYNDICIECTEKIKELIK